MFIKFITQRKKPAVFALVAISLAVFFAPPAFAANPSQIFSPKYDWQMNEAPAFEINYPKASLVRRIFSWAISPVYSSRYAEAKLFSAGGGMTDLKEGEDFTAEISANGAKVVLSPRAKLKPGKQTLSLRITSDGNTYDLSQDFTWGVLAINTNKSIYAVGETANLQIAVLDDGGKTICDAKLRLEIRPPASETGNSKFEIQNLSTEDGTIEVNEEVCRSKAFTLAPDYSAAYRTGNAGEYQMKLTAETADGTREIIDSFRVENSALFDVERVSATRIFPGNKYPVIFNITANQDFQGRIVEEVPKDFEIENLDVENSLEISNLKFKILSQFQILNNGNKKQLIWDADVKKGDQFSLGYRYNAPDVSPQLYLLGPLQFKIRDSENSLFSEARRWQIAVDDVATNSPSSTDSGWTNSTNAYADGGGYANITSGTPSVSNTYGDYGFSLTGSVINQVRVRMDAWSIGGSASSQTQRPSGDDADTASSTVTPPSPTTRWDKVDEASYDDNDYYTMTANGGGHTTFTFPSFSVPAGSTITNLTVYYRAGNSASNAANIRATLKVNGTYYDTIDSGADPVDYPDFQTYSYAFTTNPASGSAWTVEEINGGGTYPLQAFGTASSDLNPDVRVSWVYATVNYTTANNEQIRMDVSWDGGSSWSSSKHVQNLTGTETSYWVDVTSDTSWTPDKLSNANFKVRVDGYTVGDAGDVRLDWIPVEVTYTPPITVSGTTNLGVGTTVAIAVNSTPGASTTVQSGSPNTWSFSTVVTSGQTVTVWADGVGDSSESTAVTNYDGLGNITGMVLDSNVLSVGSDDSSVNVSRANMDQYDCSEDEDIMHQAAGSTLKVEGDSCAGSVSNSYSAEKIDILTGDTLTISGTETLTTYDLAISGTGTLTSGGNSTYNIAHDWTNNSSGTFTASTSTVNFNGSTAQTITSAGDSFNLINFNNSSASNPNINYTGSLTISNNTTLSNNTRIAATDNTAISFGGTVNGNYSLSVDAGSSVVSFNSTVGDSSALTDFDVSAATINLNSTGVTVDSGAGGNTITFTGAVSLGADVTIDTDGASDNSVNFTSTVNSTDVTDRAFAVTAGTADITIGGAIGATNDLSSLTISGNDISLNNIGGDASGVTGATAVTGDTNGTIILTGTTYKTVGTQAFNAGGAARTITLNEAVTFTTADSAITFTGLVDSQAGEANAITLAAGTAQVTFNNNVGATQSIGLLTKEGAGDLRFTSATLIATGLTLSAGTINNAAADSGAWTVSGDVTISAGTLKATNNTFSVGGSWSNSGSFISNSGTVILNGSAQQTLSGTMTGSSAFHNLTITNNSGADATDNERTNFIPSVDFAAAVKVSGDYTITTASVRVEYESGQTYEFANINWNGQASDSRIFFRNSAVSGTWLLKVTGTQTSVSYVNVSRSDASVAGGSEINATNGTNYDAQNNSNWNFGAGGPVPMYQMQGNFQLEGTIKFE